MSDQLNPTGAETPEVVQETPAIEVPNSAQSIFGEESSSVTEQNQIAPEVVPAVAPTEPVVPAPVAMTQEQIVQMASQSVMQAQQAQQTQQTQEAAKGPRQYTPEELNLFQVDENLFNQIFDSEDKAVAIQALNTMLQGTAKQAFTMAQLNNREYVGQQIGEVNQRIEPHISFAQQQQEQHMVHEFYTTYPDLKGMDQVVSQVTAGLRQEGKQYKTPKELFSEVATRTQAIIQHISGGQQPGVVPVQGQTPTQIPAQQVQQKPSMASVGAGGTGGAGGGQGQQQTNTNAAKSIFG